MWSHARAILAQPVTQCKFQGILGFSSAIYMQYILTPDVFMFWQMNMNMNEAKHIFIHTRLSAPWDRISLVLIREEKVWKTNTSFL